MTTLVERGRIVARCQTMTSELETEDHIAWKLADRVEELEAKLHHCETVSVRGEERDITEFDK